MLKEKYTLRSNLICTSIIEVHYLHLNALKLQIMPQRMLKYDVISATFPKALIFHGFTVFCITNNDARASQTQMIKPQVVT